jgi:hypothetical protein
MFFVVSHDDDHKLIADALNRAIERSANSEGHDDSHERKEKGK